MTGHLFARTAPRPTSPVTVGAQVSNAVRSAFGDHDGVVLWSDDRFALVRWPDDERPEVWPLWALEVTR